VRQAYIKQSVILNYQVCHDKTSSGCYIPTHCPRLPANVTATLSPPIGRMDSAIRDERGGVCGRRRDGQTRVRAGASPSSPRSSLPSRRPAHPRAVATHGGLSGAGTRTDGRTDGRPGKRRRSLITGVRLHTNMTLLQYYEQSHAVTK